MQDQCERINFNIYEEPNIDGICNINVDEFVQQEWVPEFLDDIWVEHFKQNLPKVRFSNITNIGVNKAIVLVGASPAIKRQVQEFKAIAADQNFIIISSNGAYKFLLQNGVTPHYVMLVEGRCHVEKDFDVKDLKQAAPELPYPFADGTRLVASPYVSPKILNEWDGPIEFHVLGGGKKYSAELHKCFNKELLDVGGGNVIATAMLWAFKYIRARHFIFTGTSLCYYDDYYWDQRDTSHVCSKEMFEEKKMKSADMYGNIVNMTPSLCLYKVWLEAQTKYAPDSVITNSTEDGVFGIYPKPIGRDGDNIQFQLEHVPWINIIPLRLAIEAYQRQWEDQKHGTR